LQRARPEVWIHLPVDAFLALVPFSDREDEVMAEFVNIGVGIHAGMGAIVRAGNRVIIDHVFAHPAINGLLRGELAGVPSLWVAVDCPLEELERREAARGDRGLGTARSQIGVVHDGVDYDLRVDTSRMTVAECAAAITLRLDQRS
jgi:chloramphenicol 3-O phosphotransferase